MRSVRSATSVWERRRSPYTMPRNWDFSLICFSFWLDSTLSMNTLSDDGGWIGDDLLAELASQSVQDAVLGFQYPRLVLSHTSLDEVEAFDHHAPEECG